MVGLTLKSLFAFSNVNKSNNFNINNIDDVQEDERIIEFVPSIPIPFHQIQHNNLNQVNVHKISVCWEAEGDHALSKDVFEFNKNWKGLNNCKSPSNNHGSSKIQNIHCFVKPQRKKDSEKVGQKLLVCTKSRQQSKYCKESIASTQDSDYYLLQKKNKNLHSDTEKGMSILISIIKV